MTPPSVDELAWIVLGVVAWAALTFSLGWAGGWSRMGEFYAATGRFEGRRLYFRSARFGSWVGYNSALTIGVNRDGLSLRVWPIFRVGHPPLFIPWSELEASPGDTRWIATVCFKALRCPDVPITMTRRQALRIAKESGGAFALSAD